MLSYNISPLVTQGLRMTEFSALLFESLDLAHNTILVDSTLQYDKLTNRFFLDITKTQNNEKTLTSCSLNSSVSVGVVVGLG